MRLIFFPCYRKKFVVTQWLSVVPVSNTWCLLLHFMFRSKQPSHTHYYHNHTTNILLQLHLLILCNTCILDHDYTIPLHQKTLSCDGPYVTFSYTLNHYQKSSKIKNYEVSYRKNDGPDVTFSWMKLPVWNTRYSAGTLGRNLCVWKCHLWSIALSRQAHNYANIQRQTDTTNYPEIHGCGIFLCLSIPWDFISVSLVSSGPMMNPMLVLQFVT